MRILQVGIGFPGPDGVAGPVTLGGTAKVMHANARELVRRGHEVTVWCTNRLDQRRKFSEATVRKNVDGIDVWYLNTHCLPFWPGTFGPSYTPELAEKIRQELDQFDVIHLNELRSYMTLTVSRAARAKSIPYVVQPHGSVYMFYNSQLIKKAYDALFRGQVLQEASAVLALQGGERQKCVEVGVPAERIHLLPNGMDMDSVGVLPERGAFRARYGLGEEPVVLFVGRFEKRKGPDILVHAFRYIQDLRTKLVMVGPDDGSLAEVQEIVRDSGFEQRVIFTGPLTGSDLWSAYVDCDVMAFPSRFEVFGLIIMEACVAGKPMVVTDTCQISDWLKDEAAVLAPPEPYAFGIALDRLLSDPAEQRRLGEGARRLVETRFSLPEVAGRLEDVYRYVMGRADRS